MNDLAIVDDDYYLLLVDDAHLLYINNITIEKNDK
jgi:hypothetical protein